MIDIFTKYAFISILKDKNKIAVSNAFENIIEKSHRRPYRLWRNGGGEFYNHYIRNMLKTHPFELYSTQSELKAIMIERFNQTLMNKISRMFTERDSYRYIDDIDDIVKKYNNTYNSCIKMTPTEASKVQKERIVYYNLYNKRRRKLLKSNNRPKFRKGDKIRIYRYKKSSRKGMPKNGVMSFLLFIKLMVLFHLRIELKI